MRWTPNPTTIYLGDNGRSYCGDHLGSFARHTGRDLSGQPVLEVTPEIAAEAVATYGQPLACEECGRAASLLHTVA